MRLITHTGHRIGVVADDNTVVDVTALASVDPDHWPPTGMTELISRYDTLGRALRAASTDGGGVPLHACRLEAPIQWPNKLVAFPANYDLHIAEMRSTNRSDLNGFFLKAPSSLIGPADEIVLPDIPGCRVHHEAELAVVIGRTGHGVEARDALDHVFGYMCLVDVTVRGEEERVMRKSFDTFCPIGPWVTTADEIDDPDDLVIDLKVNGHTRQLASTSGFILGVREMIALASSVMTLYPGDIIATGTPSGVGPLVGGDTLDISISGVGSMSLSVSQGVGGDNVAFRNSRRDQELR